MSSFDNIYLKRLEAFFNPYIGYVEKELAIINFKKPESLGRIKYLEFVVSQLKQDELLVKNSELIDEDGNNLILIPKTNDNTKVKIKFDKDRDIIQKLNFFSISIQQTNLKHNLNILYTFSQIFNVVEIKDSIFKYNINVMDMGIGEQYFKVDSRSKSLPIIKPKFSLRGTPLLNKKDSLEPDSLFLINESVEKIELTFNKDFFEEEQKDYYTLFNDIDLNKYSDLKLDITSMKPLLQSTKKKKFILS